MRPGNKAACGYLTCGYSEIGGK